MTGRDGRSVGELLLDADHSARDVLIDVGDLDAAAMLRRADILAYVATTNPDGSPHVTPTWVDVDTDRGLVLVNSAEGRRKVRNLRRDPRVMLAAHAPDPAGLGVLAQRVDHRATDPAFGERLELDPTAVVEAVSRVDQSDDAVLHEIAEVNGMRHGCGHAAGQSLHEG